MSPKTASRLPARIYVAGLADLMQTKVLPYSYLAALNFSTLPSLPTLPTYREFGSLGEEGT